MSPNSAQTSPSSTKEGENSLLTLKTERREKGRRPSRKKLPSIPLVKESPRPLTFKKLEKIQSAYDAWWAAAHGDDEKVYARKKGVLYSLATEYLPEMVELSRNTLRVRAG